MKVNKEKLDIVKELHKPARRNFARRKTVIKGYGDLWQIDLAEMQQYSHQNRGYRYILVVIDCYSKYMWTRPIKNKTGREVTEAMEDIIREAGYTPTNLQSDNGTEFYNRSFSELMAARSINHYSTFSTKKAAIVERAIRTLKSWLYQTFSSRGQYKWIDIIKKTTKQYNTKKHRTTGMRPIDVTYKVHISAYNYPKIALKAKYRVGDMVRLSKYKSVFEKGFTANFTPELFKIVKVNITNPTTYLLEDVFGHPIKGCFYEHELLKTKYPHTYLVEKVLKKKGNKLFVKWLGFSNAHNSWIEKTAIV